jgi:hypothetical protein
VQWCCLFVLLCGGSSQFNTRRLRCLVVSQQGGCSIIAAGRKITGGGF